MRSVVHYLLFAGIILLTGCLNGSVSENTCADDLSSEKTDKQPCIYVSIVTHNEEPTTPKHPDFYKDRGVFFKHRKAIISFAQMLHEEGVMYNFQSDWNFLLACSEYDSGDKYTNGKNLLRYLKEDLQFEIDPHAHEKKYNYADVAFLIEELGVPESNLAGGLLALPPELSKLEYFWQTLKGDFYDTAWKADCLWGGGTSMHVDEESLWVSGIWRPMNNKNFLVHDENAPVPHIGGFRNDWDGLKIQLEYLKKGLLEPGKIYTQTIFCAQSQLLQTGFAEKFRHRIKDFSDEFKAGHIRWVGLNELMDIWHIEYESRPNMFHYSKAIEKIDVQKPKKGNPLKGTTRNKDSSRPVKIRGKVFYNLTYKTVEHETLALDIYMPLADKFDRAPVLVYIHGGVWRSGDKAAVLSFEPFITGIRNEGYAVASINYRLVDNERVFPGNVADCKDSIRWLRKSAKKYNLDATRIGVWGSSAGGHLALLAGLSGKSMFAGSAELENYDASVDYIIDFFGPVDLSSLRDTDTPTVVTLLGGTAEEIPDIYTQANPVTHLEYDSPPVFIVHGDDDKAVDLYHSQILQDKAVQLGHDTLLTIVKNGGHTAKGLKNGTDPVYSQLMNMITEFIISR